MNTSAVARKSNDQTITSWVDILAWRDLEQVVVTNGEHREPATAEELPASVAGMDWLHVVRLGAEALDEFAARDLWAPGYKGDPAVLFAVDRATDRQHETHREPSRPSSTWRWSYQPVIAAYRDTDRAAGQATMPDGLPRTARTSAWAGCRSATARSRVWSSVKWCSRKSA